ncbi:MAG: DUF3536 domain-containing protein [bacterium]
MNRYICIHGHFYQPPRENPWLEEVEQQDSAYPYHDWNQRVTAECYASNASSRILDPKRRIIDITNNYSKMSFNFGPTLLSWLKRKEPDIYQAVLEADQKSKEYFSGHGAAIAQCYNHLIMPLADSRDKRTQIIWGIKDFEAHFKRKPEGMWLPEAAVDLESLDILAESGIKFSILAPGQAKQVREIDEDTWEDVSTSRIDPKMPYLCHLPSGRTINLFFYDGPIARDVAFNNLLVDGKGFADRLLSVFSDNQDYSQLVHIATDGETYGHHHHFGDMALAYALYYLESNNLAKITIYGEFLEKQPPIYEVEIFENSSWSCCHGIERWKGNCGCNSGIHPGWNQEWRSTLRGAMDWLRDNLINIYEKQASQYLKDVWQARDDYIEVVLNRSIENVDTFLERYASKELNSIEKITVLKLLEMQRQAMFMYTSCGWFFDEVSGIETVQIIQFAARAIQLAKETSNLELEETYINLLERAKSNIPEYENGANIYKTLVKPGILDIVRVGAHYAVSSLFEEYTDPKTLYCYTAKKLMYDRLELGKQKVAIGKVKIRSEITWEEDIISFALLHLGDHNLIGGGRPFIDEESFTKMHKEIKRVFEKSDISGVIRLIEQYFHQDNYSLWHLFRDEQRKVLNQLLEYTFEGVESSLRQIDEHHYPTIQLMRELKIPLPKIFSLTAELILHLDLIHSLETEELDLVKLRRVVEETKKRSLKIDKVTLSFIANKRINAVMEGLAQSPEMCSLLEIVESLMKILTPLSLDLILWKAQNIYFDVGKRCLEEMLTRAEQGEEEAKRWVELFTSLGEYLRVSMGI